MDTAFFAQAFTQPSGSPIRELFPYLSRPGMISFAGGYPSPSLFDLEGLQEAAARALAERAVFQYGATEGQMPLREQLVQLCALRGITAQASAMMVTTGSQQAFDLLVRTLIDPGDIVLVESPAYPATLQALKLAAARVVEIPTDDQGLSVDATRAALAELPAGQKPKLLYTVPNFSNPGGTVLAEARRRALVELALERGFLIVEDDPYGELNFTGVQRASIYQYGQELGEKSTAQGAEQGGNPVVYLSSLSKTVSPALRTGWMLAGPELLRRCAIAKQTVDLCTSPVTQAIAAAYLQLGRYSAAVQSASAEYRARMQRMAEELNTRLGAQTRFVQPEGGMFLWLSLTQQPRAVDPQALFDAAVERGVIYVPGKAFYAQPCEAGAQSMRLSFAAPTVDEVAQGVERLQAAFESLGAC